MWFRGGREGVLKEGVEGAHSLVGINEGFLEEVVYKVRHERRTEIYLILRAMVKAVE